MPSANRKSGQRPNSVYIPRLTYRNAAPTDTNSSIVDIEGEMPPLRTSESDGLTSKPGPEVPEARSMKSQKSLTSIKMAADVKPPSSTPKSGRISSKSSSSKSTQPPKRRGSIFSGIFNTKEPSIAAFAQMEEQLKKQQATGGRLQPVGMPGVSSAKMPEKVPKVNSKWDGLPTGFKERQKQQERRQSSSNSVRSRSAGPEGRYSQDRRMSNSTVNSFDSRGGTSDKYRTHHTNPSSSSGTPSFGAGDWAENAPTETTASLRSQSLKYPSTTSLHDTISTTSDVIPETPKVPEHFKSAAFRNQPIRPKSSLPSQLKIPSQAGFEAGLASPKTPTELSPVTPLPVIQETSTVLVDPDDPDRENYSKKTENMLIFSSGTKILELPCPDHSKGGVQKTFLTHERKQSAKAKDSVNEQPNRSVAKKPSGVFSQTDIPSAIASRTKEEETTSEDSKTRLGLQTTISKDSMVAPWEWQGLDLKTLKKESNSLGPKSSSNANKGSKSGIRAKLPLFGKD